MSTEVIREFLVSLGYKVDTTGQRRFVDGVQSVSKEVLALGAVAAATGAAMLAFVSKTASGLEELYFASQRTKASAANIKALGFAADQMGSSASAMQGTIESLAKFLRINPAGESLIKSWGIQTRDANGELRDTTDLLKDLGHLFRGMPYAQAYARANFLGIDEKSLQALIKGTDEFSARYQQILKRYGLDVDSAAEKSHLFEVRLRDLKANFEVLSLVVGDRLIGILNQLQYRWDSLDDTTKSNIQTVAKWVAGVVAGLAVLAGGPIAWVTALATAIGLLWDDYKTWKEGGKSLIDWKAWEPGITAATDAVKTLVGWIEKLEDSTRKALDSLGKWAAQKLATGDSLGRPGSLGRKVFEGIAYANGYDPRTGEKIPVDTQSEWSGLSAAQKKGYIDRYQALSEGAKKAYDKSFPGLSAAIRKEISTAPEGGAAGSAQLFKGLEQKYGLPSGLLDRVWATESGRGQNMHSSAGAEGHFQFMPATAAQYGLKNPYDLKESADAAARMYHDLLLRNGGDLTRALAGYNWGQGNLEKYGLGDAPEETRRYIEKIQGTSLHENGSNPYSDAMYRQAAGGQISQQTTINVYGTDKPEETASAVGSAQDSVNQRLVRNFQTTAAM